MHTYGRNFKVGAIKKCVQLDRMHSVQSVKVQSNATLWLSLPCQADFWSSIFRLPSLVNPHKSIPLKIHIWLVLLSGLHLCIWCSQWCTANTVYLGQCLTPLPMCLPPSALGHNKGELIIKNNYRDLGVIRPSIRKIITAVDSHQQNGLENEEKDVLGF